MHWLLGASFLLPHLLHAASMQYKEWTLMIRCGIDWMNVGAIEPLITLNHYPIVDASWGYRLIQANACEEEDMLTYQAPVDDIEVVWNQMIGASRDSISLLMMELNGGQLTVVTRGQNIAWFNAKGSQLQFTLPPYSTAIPPLNNSVENMNLVLPWGKSFQLPAPQVQNALFPSLANLLRSRPIDTFIGYGNFNKAACSFNIALDQVDAFLSIYHGPFVVRLLPNGLVNVQVEQSIPYIQLISKVVEDRDNSIKWNVGDFLATDAFVNRLSLPGPLLLPALQVNVGDHDIWNQMIWLVEHGKKFPFVRALDAIEMTWTADGCLLTWVTPPSLTLTQLAHLKHLFYLFLQWSGITPIAIHHGQYYCRSGSFRPSLLSLPTQLPSGCLISLFHEEQSYCVELEPTPEESMHLSDDECNTEENAGKIMPLLQAPILPIQDELEIAKLDKLDVAKLDKSGVSTPNIEHHPLEHGWHFWVMPARWKLEHFVKIKPCIETIEMFWQVFNNLPNPASSSSYTQHFFRAQVKIPTWEDPLNLDGGLLKISIDSRAGTETEVYTYWRSILLRMIGNEPPFDQVIRGAIFKVRKYGYEMDIWCQGGDQSIYDALVVALKGEWSGINTPIFSFQKHPRL